MCLYRVGVVLFLVAAAHTGEPGNKASPMYMYRPLYSTTPCINSIKFVKSGLFCLQYLALPKRNGYLVGVVS